MWRASQSIEDALYRAAAEVIDPAWTAGAPLTAAVLDRSRRYTSDRARLAERSSPGDLAARALFFSIADAVKVQVPLAELAGRGLLPGDRLRIVDLGAGCGAMSLGAVEHLAGHGTSVVELCLVDRDRDALDIAARAVERLARGLSLTCQVAVVEADVASYRPPHEVDLIVAGSVLNELTENDRHAVVDRALAALSPGGALIIVEPALRDTSRALHRLRDRVLAAGAAHVFAPCTRRAWPCPALADERDWCHEDRPIELPNRTAQLAQVTGLRDGAMKFSYLVLRRGAEPLVHTEGVAARVVSRPHREKGKIELTMCGDGGWIEARLLRRARSDANRPFERARRGDVLLLPAWESEVGAGTTIERIDPAE